MSHLVLGEQMHGPVSRRMAWGTNGSVNGMVVGSKMHVCIARVQKYVCVTVECSNVGM